MNGTTRRKPEPIRIPYPKAVEPFDPERYRTMIEARRRVRARQIRDLNAWWERTVGATRQQMVAPPRPKRKRRRKAAWAPMPVTRKPFWSRLFRAASLRDRKESEG